VDRPENKEQLPRLFSLALLWQIRAVIRGQHHEWHADSKLQMPRKRDGFPDEWVDLDGLEAMGGVPLLESKGARSYNRRWAYQIGLLAHFEGGYLGEAIALEEKRKSVLVAVTPGMQTLNMSRDVSTYIYLCNMYIYTYVHTHTYINICMCICNIYICIYIYNIYI